MYQDQRRTKLDDKSAKFIFIGYDARTKGYKLCNKKIHIEMLNLMKRCMKLEHNKEEYTIYLVLESHEPEQVQEPPSPTSASPTSEGPPKMRSLQEIHEVTKNARNP